jgi:hypothetical protein
LGHCRQRPAQHRLCAICVRQARALSEACRCANWPEVE